MNLVVDTNILISALLKDGQTREIIVNSEHILLIPEIIYDEIEEHREEFLKKSKLLAEDFNELISILSRYLTIIPNEKLLKFLDEAESIIGNIDKDDVPIIATSLANDKCPI